MEKISDNVLPTLTIREGNRSLTSAAHSKLDRCSPGPNCACIFRYNSLLLYVNMQTKNRTYGVLVADVVQSRSYSHLRSSLNEKLRIASTAQLDDKLIRMPYAITAGDEFQTMTLRVDSIPKLILDLRRRLQ